MGFTVKASMARRRIGKNLTEEQTWVSLNRVNDSGAVSGDTSEPHNRAFKCNIQPGRAAALPGRIGNTLL